MDTRNKILTLPAEPALALSLAPARPLVMVTGWFDVLRAAHARQLQEVRQRTGAATLMAVVLPNPDEVLAQRARAELVAGLRVIDYVLTPDYADVDRIAEALQPSAVVRLEEDDARRIRELIAHVHRCQAR